MAYTAIDNPELYFQAKIYTGNGSTQTVTYDNTDADLDADFVWIKERTSNDHELYDTVRGATKRIYSNTTAVEDTNSTGLTAFATDTFTLGGAGGTNNNTDTYVAWCWKESNSDAGMDIVTWTGNGSSQNISHSLSAVPHFMITKNRSATGDWTTYHKFGGGTKTFYLSNTDAIGTTSSPWNDTTPTSSVFTVGAGAYTNGDGNNIIGY